MRWALFCLAAILLIQVSFLYRLLYRLVIFFSSYQIRFNFTVCPLRVNGFSSAAVETQMSLSPIYLLHTKTWFSIQAIEKKCTLHLLLPIFLMFLPNSFYVLGFQSAVGVVSTLPIYFLLTSIHSDHLYCTTCTNIKDFHIMLSSSSSSSSSSSYPLRSHPPRSLIMFFTGPICPWCLVLYYPW